MNLRVTREEPLRLMSVHAHPDDESSKGAGDTGQIRRRGRDLLWTTVDICVGWVLTRTPAGLIA